MKSWVEKANAEIVGKLSSGGRVVCGKVGAYYVVTCEPYHMAHVFRKDQVFFAIEKVKNNEQFTKTFEHLFDLAKTAKPENKIEETGAYYSGNGKTFLKELKGERGAVWANVSLLKDVSPYASFYQESKETTDKPVERLPILVIDSHGIPVRIVLPALKI